MNSEEIAAIKHAFDLSLDPLWKELRAMNATLAGEGGVVHILRDHGDILRDHGDILRDHSEILRKQGEILHGIDSRLTNVEGILAGVEILVRKQAG